MAINISFNNTNYTIDEASLSSALAALKSHLSTTMNGTGAVIMLDGVSYNIDATKLSAATTDFVNHLGTISGTGHKVMVGGVEYGVSADKVAGAVGELGAALDGLNSGGAGKLVEFDGDLTGWEYYNMGNSVYIKVSDKPLDVDDLIGSTVTTVSNLDGKTLEVVPEYTKEVLLTEDNIMKREFSETFTLVLVSSGAVEHVVSIFGDSSEAGLTLPEGTYFAIFNIEDGYFYTKSISCLTEDAPSEPTEERLEGDGAEYYTLAPTALSFRSTAPLNELQEIQINGVTVDPSNYTLEEGSTIVTFPIEYLKTLNVGNYEVAVASDSKTVKGGFTVAAPELNEYGFYYNQPYTAWVDYFGGTTTFFFREDGTMDCMVNGLVTETATYTSGSHSVVVNSMMGTFNGAISDDGYEVYCAELATNFVFGDEHIVADDDYIYIYNDELCGYEVQCIDKTKSSYGAIKTGINGIDTVKISDFACNVNESLKSITIPASVTIIGESAFCVCSSLVEVAFEEGSKLTNIDGGAFIECTSLTNITIPDSVTSIDINVFSDCDLLSSITFEGTMAQWSAITKGNGWNHNVPATYVQCSDGQVAL